MYKKAMLYNTSVNISELMYAGKVYNLYVLCDYQDDVLSCVGPDELLCDTTTGSKEDTMFSDEHCCE